MTPEQRIEYQTVVLGALLYDFGKYLQTGELEPTATLRPPQPGWNFVAAWRDKFARCTNADLLETLARCRHESASFPHTFQIDAIVDARHRALARLVCHAHKLASGQREERYGEAKGFHPTALIPVFSRVWLLGDKHQPSGYLTPAELGRLTEEPPIFPLLRSEGQAFQDRAAKHFQGLASAFVGLKDQLDWNTFETVYAHFLSLLHRFASFIAADTQADSSDVPLYDHMRIASALAACFYRYHVATATLSDDAIQNPPRDRLALLAGDVSGIQDYLFDIATVGAGGVARRLRARSFFLQMLAEIAALKVLRVFDLPLGNMVMASGGNFFILLPNLPGVPDTVSTLQRECETWFLEQFHGTLTINLAWTQVLDAEFGAGEHHTGFSQVLTRAREALARQKQNRLRHVLMDSSRWQNNAFLREPFPKNATVCLACHRFPAERRSDPDGTIDVCLKCHQDVRLGRLLPTARMVGFYDRSEQGTPCFDWTFAVAADPAELPTRPVLVIRLNDTDLTSMTHMPATFRFLANYVPHEPDGSPWTFEDIAARHKLSDGERGSGSLAVVKADVDYLGQVFQHGLRRDTPPSFDTLSRLAAMSRQFDLFFSAWIEWMLTVEFQDTYAVYSGGDDLLLVAPRSRALDLLKRLRGAFAQFVQNPELTLSAGVVVVKPRLPLAHTVQFADRALERAKITGRNKLCLLDNVVPWNDLQVIEDSVRLMERANPPSAFLNQLLRLSELWERWTQYQEVQGLRALSLLAYTISRNLERGTELFEWASRLVAFPVNNPVGQEAKIMDNLGLIARWVLLGRREGEDGERP